MLLNTLRCDGCGRGPKLIEWLRAEFTSDGYAEWRHPGRIFREAGIPLSYENKDRCARLFEALFGHPPPEEMAYLCPECQEWALRELPGLAALDKNPGPEDRTIHQQPYYG